MVLALTSTQQTVGWILAVLLLIGWILYYWFNIRSARAEIGAELELAANKKTPPPDEELEGRRLENVQFLGVVFLLIIGLGLPLYWLREPGRQEAAADAEIETFISRGEALYNEGFQCSSCHGAEGVGGVAPFILAVPALDEAGEPVFDDEGNPFEYRIRVNWVSPSLNDVFLRYSEEEVEEILIYGRQNSPMPAWGVAGGGAGSDQEIQNVIDYLRSIQITSEEAIANNTAALEAARTQATEAGEDFDDGEWLFAQHCARCHTQGWAWAGTTAISDLAAGQAAMDEATQDLPEGSFTLPIGSQGGGAFGPRLAQENLPEQFLTVQDMVDFIARGANDNEAYGTRGLGNGQMPGYGEILTEEQIRAIVVYERSLTHEDRNSIFDQIEAIIAAGIDAEEEDEAVATGEDLEAVEESVDEEGAQPSEVGP